jgi:hypothetical protein
MKDEQKNQAIQAVKDRAIELGWEYFHNQDKPWATVPIGNHRENWRIDKYHFKLLVTKILYEQLGARPPKALIADCIEDFKMMALFKGKEYELFIRAAEHDGKIYIDMVNERWQAIEVSPNSGWGIVDEPPIKFRRENAMASLPKPLHEGKPEDLLKVLPFLNIPPQNGILFLAWLTHSLRSGVPYPVLVLTGPQGAAKSTVTKVARELMDPCQAKLTQPPRTERDLAIAANNQHLVAMDNLSKISPAFSDVMCMVSTGGAYRERKFYTNDGQEEIFTYRRPQIVNGIEDGFIERPDLLDRTILLHLEPIPGKRIEERRFWKEFEEARPSILSGLLETISVGLGKVDSVALDSVPRMADFARWGVAIEESLGYPSGTFISAYRANREEVHTAAIEASPVAVLIYDYLRDGKGQYRGTALRLLQELTDFAERRDGGAQKCVRKHPQFPKSANQLSGQIARVVPNLAAMGVAYARGHNSKSRWISLKLEAA